MFFVLTITPAFCASSRDVASRPGVVSVVGSDDVHTPESTNVTNRAVVNSARSQSNTRNPSASRAGNTARRESATTKRETTNRTTQSRTTNVGARATQSRTARTASSRTPTVTARSASTQVRSASNTRAARSATNAIGTSQGATKNAVKSRTATAGKSRAASNTITRARTTSATALINSDVSGMMEYCKTQYTQCMDNFCDVLDDAQGRCSCSKNIKNYAKTSTAQKEANAALQDIAQQIQYIGLSRDEVETLFTQTEAELTMQGNTDNSQIKNSLDKIKEMIVDVKPGTAVSTETDSGFSFNLDGLLDFNLDSMGFDLASIFGNNNSGTSSISNQRGEQLYKTASARCKKSVLESCQAQGINITLIENSYDLEIDRACIAYERSLSDGNDDIVQTVRNAQTVLQRARLMVEQQKNVYDLRGCVGALDACMQDDFVCGSDYELCLDPTGKYIVEGEVVVGSTPGYVIEGASSVPPSKEYGNNTLMGTWYYDGKFAWGATTQDGSLMDYISKYVTPNPIRNTSSNMAEFLQHKIGYNEKGKNYGMCMSVLNKCQNLTYDKKTGNYIPNNQVITEYLARTLVQIKRAQDAVLADYAESCITDVSSCLSTNNFDTTASNSKQNIAINACRSQIKTCMSVNGNSASEPDPADLRNWVMAMMGALLDEDIPSGGNSGGSTGGNSGTQPGQSSTPTNNPYTQTNPKSPMLIQAHLTDVSTGAQIAVYEDTQTNACYANPANTSNVNDACVVKCDISSATSGICNPSNTVTLTVDNASAVSTYALRSGVSLTFNGLNTSSIKIALENGQLPSSLGWVRDLSDNTNYRFDGIVGPDGTEYYDKNGNRVRTGITAGTTLTAVYAYDGYKQACVDSGGTWQNESCSCTASGTIYDEESAACMCNVAENFTGTPTMMGCQCADGFEFANGTCRQKESGGTTPDQPEPDQPSPEQTACTNAGGTWNGTTCDCGAGKEWNGTACVSTGGTTPDQPEPDLPSTEQTACTNTGGTWNGTICECAYGYSWDSNNATCVSLCAANETPMEVNDTIYCVVVDDPEPNDSTVSNSITVLNTDTGRSYVSMLLKDNISGACYYALSGSYNPSGANDEYARSYTTTENGRTVRHMTPKYNVGITLDANGKRYAPNVKNIACTDPWKTSPTLTTKMYLLAFKKNSDGTYSNTTENLPTLTYNGQAVDYVNVGNNPSEMHWASQIAMTQKKPYKYKGIYAKDYYFYDEWVARYYNKEWANHTQTIGVNTKEMYLQFLYSDNYESCQASNGRICLYKTDSASNIEKLTCDWPNIGNTAPGTWLYFEQDICKCQNGSADINKWSCTASSPEQTACTNAGGTWNGTTCDCGAGKEWNGTACVSTGGTTPDQPEPEQYSFAQWCNAEGQETYHEPGTLSVDGVCTFKNTSYNGGNANPFKFIKHATWQIVDTDASKNQCLINGGFVHQYLQDNSKLTICACPDTETTGGNALAERENGVCKCMPSFVRDTAHAPYDCICPSGMQKSATLLMMDKVIDHTDDSLTIERLRRDYLGNANLQVNVHTGDFAAEVSAQTRLYDKNGNPITMPCSLYESVNASNGGHAFWMCKPTCTPIDTFKRVCEATNGNWNAASNKCSCDTSAGLIWKDKMLPHCTCRTGSIYGGFKKDSFNPATGSCECDSDREKWVFSDGEAKCVPIGSYCDDKTKACRCDASKNFTESSRVDTEMNADGYYYFNYNGQMTEDPSYHFGCRCKVGYEMVQGPDGKMVCESGGNEPDVPTQPSAEQTACTNAGGTWNGTTCECTNGLLWNGSKCLPKCSAGTYIGNNGAKSFAEASCTCADVKVLVSNRITNGSVKTWLDGAVIQKQIKFDEHVWTVVQDDDSSPSNKDAYCVSADMNGLSSSCKQNSTNLYVNYDEPSCADVTYDACYEYELNTDRTDATLNKCCQFSGGEVFMFADTNNDGLFEASCHCGDVKSCVESSSNTCTAQMISNSMWDATKTWLGRDNNCYSTALLSSCRDNEAMSTCSCDNGRVTVTRGLTTYCLTREVASKVNACINSNGSWSINTTNHKVDCTCRTGGTLTDEGTCDYSTYDKCLNPESTNVLKGQWSGGSCMCSAYSGMPGVVSIKDDKGVIIGCGCNADKGFAPNSEKTACVCPYGMYEHNGYCKCPGTAISNGNGGCMCSAGYDMSLNVRLFHTEAGHSNGAQKWYTEKLLSNGWSECTDLSIPTQKKTAGCLSSKFYMGPAAVINDPNVSFYDLLQVCPVNGACDSGTTPEWEDYASCTKIEVLDNYTYLYEQDGKPMTNSNGMQYSIKTPMGVTFDYKTGKFACDAQRGFEIYPHIAGYTVSESGMDKTPVVALVNQSTTGYHYKRNYNDITYSSTDPIYATELELQNGSFVPKTDIAPNPNLINQVTGKIEPGYNGSIYGDVMKYGTAFPTDLMCGCGDGRKLDLTSGTCISSCPAGTIDIDRFTYRYNVTNGDVFSDTCISTANLCDLANGIDFCPESDTTITKKEMPGKGYYYLTNGYVISAGENSRVKSGSKQCGVETDEYYFLWSNEYSDFLTCMRTDGCWYDLLNGKAEYDSSCNN